MLRAFNKSKITKLTYLFYCHYHKWCGLFHRLIVSILISHTIIAREKHEIMISDHQTVTKPANDSQNCFQLHLCLFHFCNAHWATAADTVRALWPHGQPRTLSSAQAATSDHHHHLGPTMRRGALCYVPLFWWLFPLLWPPFGYQLGSQL